MHDLILKSLGRGSELLDRLTGLSGRCASVTQTDRFDRTGMNADPTRTLEILHRSDDLLFAKYDKPSHSLWRAQELSLFWRHRNLLQPPVADFGCGDGSFAGALEQKFEYGIDQDPEALGDARRVGAYRDVIESDERHIPLGEQSVQTIFSNSVLEHVSDLAAILMELHRILVPEGKLLITVPTSEYAVHLSKYYGDDTSRSVNKESYHRNLFGESEWRRALTAAGFAVDLVVHYQPDWFTFWYRFHRLSGPRALGRIIPDLDRKLWNRMREKYLTAVRESIERTLSGANIFVIAHRRA
jgi:SAM-dependent methyltransferase